MRLEFNLSSETCQYEVVFEKSDVKVVRFKKPHYVYTDNEMNVESSTVQRRAKRRNESRVFRCEYIYFVCCPKNDDKYYDTLRWRGDLKFSNISKLGYDFTLCQNRCYDDDVIASHYHDTSRKLIFFYNLSEAVEISNLLKDEVAAINRANKDKMLNTLFSTQINELLKDYLYHTYGHPREFVDCKMQTWFDGDKLTEMLTKTLNDTLFKSLNELGFNAELVDFNLPSIRVNIRPKKDLFSEEKADESNTERGEN